MHEFHFFGVGGWMMIVWVLLLIALIVFVVKAIINSGQGQKESRETPLEILKRRYARGEIDKEEFEERKKELLE